MTTAETECEALTFSTKDATEGICDDKDTVASSTEVLRARSLSFQRPSHFYELEDDPAAILHNPNFNKGTAFTQDERQRLKLRGLLPVKVETMDEQVKRCVKQFRRFTVPLSKYIYLASLKERNQTLFYKVLVDNMEECLPFIYTPTVGEVCLEFGIQFRQADGMYFSKGDRGQIRNILNNWKTNTATEVAIVVVSDGSRILGLGDLGASGMGIPLGKLSLYVAVGGFHPATTLPVILDTGTNNEKLRESEFYLGDRSVRLCDDEYYPLVDEFMSAIHAKWPKALVQFEDFSNDHCFALLEKYRNRQLCFNDDIQGTGVTIAAGFANALRIAKLATRADVVKLRIVMVGAGSAATGVADQIRQLLMKKYGLTDEESRNLFYITDSRGLLTSAREDFAGLPSFKLPYTRRDVPKTFASHRDVIFEFKPQVIIGLSGCPNQFDPEVLKFMASINDRPIIFPLSNPTSKSECSFQDAVLYTKGKVVFASGSPFAPETYEGKLLKASQGNNLYAFPGIGFGSWLGSVISVSDAMLDAAAVALADAVTEDELAEGLLYPSLTRVRDVSVDIATAVLLKAYEDGNVRDRDALPYHNTDLLKTYIRDCTYEPQYLEWNDF